jgi:hypothetical protein
MGGEVLGSLSPKNRLFSVVKGKAVSGASLVSETEAKRLSWLYRQSRAALAAEN